MSDYRLVRARSTVAIPSSSPSVLITRTRSVPDLSIYSSVYKPQYSYWRTAYPLYDDWYSRYLTNRYYYPYTYRSSYLNSNYYWDTLSTPSYYRYGYPYYNYYYNRTYNPYLSSRLNYLMDRSYWWERDRYFLPTYYYRRYYDWLYD